MSTDNLLQKAMGFKIAFRHTGNEDIASLINDLIQEVVQWRELALLTADNLERKVREAQIGADLFCEVHRELTEVKAQLVDANIQLMDRDYRETIADVRASQYPV